jgi:predicted Zn-dependent peptidase
MLHARVDIEGVETQREVVKEERRLRYDNAAYARWQEEVFKRMMKDTPYEITPIGTMEDLNAAEEEDFTSFYTDFYRPDNAVLSIAGDIDVAQTKKWVEKYFATIPVPKAPIFRPEIEVLKLQEEMIDTAYDQNIQLPALFISYPAPKQYSDDYYAMEMLNTILAGGQSSKIYKSLVDNKKVAVQAGSFQYPLEDAGLNIIYGISNMGVSLDDVLGALDEEIASIKSELISEREYQKIRNQQESSFVFNFGSNSGIASALATYEAYQGDANLINTEIDKYLAVTKEDIKRVANKYLNKENRLVLYWMPGTGE